MLGLVDKYDRKVESLIAIIGDGKSDYVDDAMFELGAHPTCAVNASTTAPPH